MAKKAKRPELTKEFLTKHYLDDNMTYSEIADMTGWNRQTVFNKCQKYGLKKPKAQIYADRKRKDFKKLIPEAKLRRYYIDKKMTITEIADKMGFSMQRISQMLKEYGIPIRSAKENHKSVMNRISKEDLEKLYSESHNAQEVADILNANYWTILRWMKEYDIPVQRGKKFLQEDIDAIMQEDLKATSRQVAVALHCAEATAKKYMEKYGYGANI